MYAAYIATLGLDQTTKGTREDIWTKDKKESLNLINSPIPWYPEVAGYKVCEIRNGMCNFLGYGYYSGLSESQFKYRPLSFIQGCSLLGSLVKHLNF